jgi:hypothetical protein
MIDSENLGTQVCRFADSHNLIYCPGSVQNGDLHKEVRWKKLFVRHHKEPKETAIVFS